jgi:hypothetical protein
MVALGISDSGKWVVIGSTAFVCDGAAPPVPLLACLDEEPASLLELLEYLKTTEIGDVVPPFPLVEMLQLGLQSNSAHWLPRVICWLDELIMHEDVLTLARAYKRTLLRFELPKNVKEALTR